MAKPLSQKTRLIRQALLDHPRMKNAALAEMLNQAPERQHDGIFVKPMDVAGQKQQLKKAREEARRLQGGQADEEGAGGSFQTEPEVDIDRIPAPRARTTSSIDLLDQVFALAKECGSFRELKRLVDKCAQLESL